MSTPLEALQPTRRFSSRVENYVRYRPSYPEEIVKFLEEHIGLQKDQTIADIGSGTGLFAEILLKRGYSVIGVEPNEEMRKAAMHRLSMYGNFVMRDDHAEQTGLKASSIDLITVAQAFHWMEPASTKTEFARILKLGGHIVLAWNLRQKNTPFLRDYEDIHAQFGIDYTASKMVDEESIKNFYAPSVMEIKSFQNIKRMDFEALKGQLLSSSYIPLPGHALYEEMITRLVQLFVRYNDQGFVNMEYETKIYWNA
jgi:ubiquinone/menaquinone biosynthesis C-methylase UbiE